MAPWYTKIRKKKYYFKDKIMIMSLYSQKTILTRNVHPWFDSEGTEESVLLKENSRTYCTYIIYVSTYYDVCINKQNDKINKRRDKLICSSSPRVPL